MKHYLDKATSGDLDFIKDSFRKSLRKQPLTYEWPQGAYRGWFENYWEQLAPVSQYVVLRPSEWPEGLIAWIGYTQGQDYICHWAYTKAPFRRQGLLTALVDATYQSGRKIYQIKSFNNSLEKLGFEFIKPKLHKGK